MDTKAPAAGGTPAFEIWQVGAGVVPVDSPVRLRILRQLEHGPRTLSELVAATRKAKSTLSALHMPPLLKAGLVTQAPDPGDARVKWYRLQGSRLGSSSVDAGSLREAVLAYAQEQGLVPLRAVVAALAAPELFTRSSRPACDALATRLGALFGDRVRAPEGPERRAQVAAILEAAGFGRVAWTEAGARAQPASPWPASFVCAVADAAAAASPRPHA